MSIDMTFAGKPAKLDGNLVVHIKVGRTWKPHFQYASTRFLSPELKKAILEHRYH